MEGQNRTPDRVEFKWHWEGIGYVTPQLHPPSAQARPAPSPASSSTTGIGE